MDTDEKVPGRPHGSRAKVKKLTQDVDVTAPGPVKIIMENGGKPVNPAKGIPHQKESDSSQSSKPKRRIRGSVWSSPRIEPETVKVINEYRDQNPNRYISAGDALSIFEKNGVRKDEAQFLLSRAPVSNSRYRQSHIEDLSYRVKLNRALIESAGNVDEVAHLISAVNYGDKLARNGLIGRGLGYDKIQMMHKSLESTLKEYRPSTKNAAMIIFLKSRSRLNPNEYFEVFSKIIKGGNREEISRWYQVGHAAASFEMLHKPILDWNSFTDDYASRTGTRNPEPTDVMTGRNYHIFSLVSESRPEQLGRYISHLQSRALNYLKVLKKIELQRTVLNLDQ